MHRLPHKSGHQTAPPDDAALDAVLPPGGFVRLPTILKLIPVSRSLIFEMMKRGDFARPVKLSKNVSAWRCEDVRHFIASRNPSS